MKWTTGLRIRAAMSGEKQRETHQRPHIKALEILCCKRKLLRPLDTLQHLTQDRYVISGMPSLLICAVMAPCRTRFCGGSFQTAPTCSTLLAARAVLLLPNMLAPMMPTPRACNNRRRSSVYQLCSTAVAPPWLRPPDGPGRADAAPCAKRPGWLLLKHRYAGKRMGDASRDASMFLGLQVADDTAAASNEHSRSIKDTLVKLLSDADAFDCPAFRCIWTNLLRRRHFPWRRFVFPCRKFPNQRRIRASYTACSLLSYCTSTLTSLWANFEATLRLVSICARFRHPPLPILGQAGA